MHLILIADTSIARDQSISPEMKSIFSVGRTILFMLLFFQVGANSCINTQGIVHSR